MKKKHKRQMMCVLVCILILSGLGLPVRREIWADEMEIPKEGVLSEIASIRDMDAVLLAKEQWQAMSAQEKEQLDAYGRTFVEDFSYERLLSEAEELEKRLADSITVICEDDKFSYEFLDIQNLWRDENVFSQEDFEAFRDGCEYELQLKVSRQYEMEAELVSKYDGAEQIKNGLNVIDISLQKIKKDGQQNIQTEKIEVLDTSLACLIDYREDWDKRRAEIMDILRRRVPYPEWEWSIGGWDILDEQGKYGDKYKVIFKKLGVCYIDTMDYRMYEDSEPMATIVPAKPTTLPSSDETGSHHQEFLTADLDIYSILFPKQESDKKPPTQPPKEPEKTPKPSKGSYIEVSNVDEQKQVEKTSVRQLAQSEKTVAVRLAGAMNTDVRMPVVQTQIEQQTAMAGYEQENPKTVSITAERDVAGDSFSTTASPETTAKVTNVVLSPAATEDRTSVWIWLVLCVTGISAIGISRLLSRKQDDLTH